MILHESQPIRLCEWGQTHCGHLPPKERRALAEVAEGWRVAKRLPAAPLAFAGHNGATLCARQWVGVVETGGTTVEVYPKLDSDLLGRDTIDEDAKARSVLRSLLWMLEASGHDSIVEAGTASVAEEVPTRLLDLFALLLARNLHAELVRGLPRRYEAREADDLPAVRGRILVGTQATRNWGRPDRVACAWDEFTADTSLSRLLRCACRTLAPHVSDPTARLLLTDCAALLDDASYVDPATALREAGRSLQHFDRSLLRFRRCFRLARRLLEGVASPLEHGIADDTFVFLLDMNRVFEDYAHAALEDAFGVTVERQRLVGRLLPKLRRGGIDQLADFFWRDASEFGRGISAWIGDAKYKHLARGRRSSLSFEDVSETVPTEVEEAEKDNEWVASATTAALTPAGRLLSPDDVRQLTVYAELAHRREGASGNPPPRLALLYPFVGEGAFAVSTALAWNGSPLSLVPVRLGLQTRPANALPPLPWPSAT